jgi:hypothetical protein
MIKEWKDYKVQHPDFKVGSHNWNRKTKAYLKYKIGIYSVHCGKSPIYVGASINLLSRSLCVFQNDGSCSNMLLNVILKHPPRPLSMKYYFFPEDQIKEMEQIFISLVNPVFNSPGRIYNNRRKRT